MFKLDAIEDIRIFDAIARAGSLSAAARDLSLSVTTVSKKLGRLEAKTGFRLIQRTTRNLNFTDEGLGFLDHCRAVLSAVDDAESFAGNGTVHGTVRITAAIAFSQRQIAPRLKNFVERHPDITVQVVATNDRVDLVDQKIDVAFRQLPLGDSSFVTRTVAPDSLILCASPEYLACAGHPATPADLFHHRCLTVGDPMPRHWRLRRGDEEVIAPIQPTIGGTDGEVPHRVAIEGGGIAAKSGWDVIDDFRTGRLVRVLPDWWGTADALRVVYPVRMYQPRRVQLFVDYMENGFKATMRDCESLNLFAPAVERSIPPR